MRPAIDTPTSDSTSINIRPGVSILSVLQHLNYRPWFAIAEFVDNSLQSYLTYRNELSQVEGEGFTLQVSIELDSTDEGRITIRDNAAGIHEKDYARAFRPAEIPPDQSGLSEFGMGMKSAACWFAKRWTVRTSALGEPIERTVSFDIDMIVRDDIEELSVFTQPVPTDQHYTEIVLSDLHKLPQGRTVGKIKEHLASIYRIFTRSNLLTLRFGDEVLTYTEPAVLVAPFFKEPTEEPRRWFKVIDLDFGLGLRAHGFAALRERGSVSGAGFALFRRDRLIQGSADEGYRPEFIFGKSNSFAYQRLFGELSLEGFEVSHTKDGIRWEEHEEIVLEILKEELNRQPLPLLSQAEGYRTRIRTEDLRPGAEIAAQNTAEAVEREVPPVLDQQLEAEPVQVEPDSALPPATTASQRVIELELKNGRWRIELELSNDPAVGDWVSVYDQSVSSTDERDVRQLGVRLALAHPFTERFGGTDASQIEPLLRLAVAIMLAETAARDGGVRYAARVRHYVNELLRDALSKP